MFDSIIESAASFWDVPESWIRAVIQVESSWNPNAYNPNDPGGARGLMQITGPTARAYGVTDLSTLFDPAVNIGVGTQLLADLRRSYGDNFQRVYSAYNSGNPDLWLTSNQVAANVLRAVAALADFNESAPVASGGIIVAILLFVFGRRFFK